MTRQHITTLPLEYLLERFETLCIEQYHSVEREETRTYNRRYKQIQAILDELKSRFGDERRLLQRFFQHPNSQVRLTAAHANLAIDYARARAVFEDIAENDVGSQKLDAGMTLYNLDRGIYRPT